MVTKAENSQEEKTSQVRAPQNGESSGQPPPRPETADFRDYLQAELLRRCRTNPRYSMRAFARVLGLESSFLSRLLQGKRSITEGMIDRLSVRLALEPAEVIRFKTSLRARKMDPRSGTKKANALAYDELTIDHFHLIADWYHYAILELTTVRDFKSEPKWIAQMLDLPVPVINAAIERLIRLGLLKVTETHQLQSSGNHTTVGNRFTAAAFRKLQRDVLTMALQALEEVPMEWRDQSSITVAVSSSRLAEAKRRIQAFRRELAQFLYESEPRDNVYQLSISLYPITRMNWGDEPLNLNPQHFSEDRDETT